jgi:hypothetical protein
VRDRVLHLVARHPFLTARQLGQLLEITPRRIRKLELELIELGLLREAEGAVVPDSVLCEEFRRVGPVEATRAGLRRVSRWLGLDVSTATRHHGLAGVSSGYLKRRQRLVGALAHTIGTNETFVTLAIAAAVERRRGGDDHLSEWRSAAGCERRSCKPDGYGSYVRDGVAHGFFLEYG